MIAMECNDFEVLRQTVSGERAVDETAFASVAMLAERLERLKKASSLFAGVEFSPAVKELSELEMVSAIC